MNIKNDFKGTKDFKKYLESIKTDINYLETVSELYKYNGNDEATLEFEKVILDYNHRVNRFRKLLPKIDSISSQLESRKNPIWMPILAVFLLFYIITIPVSLWLFYKYSKEKKLFLEDEKSVQDFIQKNQNVQQILIEINELYDDGVVFKYGWSENAQQISDEINSGRSADFVQARIQVKKDNEQRRLKEAEIRALEEDAESNKKIAKAIDRFGKK